MENLQMTEVSGGQGCLLVVRGGASVCGNVGRRRLGVKRGPWCRSQAHLRGNARGGSGGRSVAYHASHRLTVTVRA